MSWNKKTNDIYQNITNQIIMSIEEGAGEFKMPWHNCLINAVNPVNVKTKSEYSGFNQLLLWLVAVDQKYSLNLWASYKQWQSIGAQVCKGEKGIPVIFYSEIEDENNSNIKRKIIKHYRVFNANQVDGYEAPKIDKTTHLNIDKIDNFVKMTGATVIHHEKLRAYYSISDNQILMPEPYLFNSPESYYSVLLHELVHWSGHKTRCDRQFGKHFGDKNYAHEEIIAELGSAFLCAELGLSIEPRSDHASYISGWLQALKSDSNYIAKVVSEANQAVKYLKSLTENNLIL